MITTIYTLKHSSNIEQVKILEPNIIVLPEAGLGPDEQRELIHSLIGKTFCTFSEILVNQVGTLIYKGVYKAKDFNIWTAYCFIDSTDVSKCEFRSWDRVKYIEWRGLSL